MFGISFTELVIIIVFAIVIINPKEYRSIFQFITKLHKQLKAIYRDCMQELEQLKLESNINNIEDEITEAEEEIKQIMGDDGKLYDSYDISDFLDKNSTEKNE